MKTPKKTGKNLNFHKSYTVEFYFHRPFRNDSFFEYMLGIK